LPQEPHFQSASIFDILKQVKPNLTSEAATLSLMQAGLDITHVPAGLNTKLGGLNEGLSIGQRRKVALARALIKESQLIILDEPSASVDDASEAVIAEVIKKASAAGKIVLLISHRENLMSDVDQLITFGALK
jgi:ATP-binding cassette subfamily C protein CydD